MTGDPLSVGREPVQRSDFRRGLVLAAGALVALLGAVVVVTLQQPLTLIFVALFISIGLQPVIRILTRVGLPRKWAVPVVILGFLAGLCAVAGIVVPAILVEGPRLIGQLPALAQQLLSHPWAIEVNDALDGSPGNVLTGFAGLVQDPAIWVAIANGIVGAGLNLFNTGFSFLFVAILTTYLAGRLDEVKGGFSSLLPRSRRSEVGVIVDDICIIIGRYLSGMAILAVLNAAFTLLVLTLASVSYAPLLAVLALPITFIPLIGSVISMSIVTAVALLNSPGQAIVVLVSMLIYMQVEAYVLTPRIVGSVIRTPPYLVLIGALLGGTLLGLLGALIACPTIASTMLILRRTVIPRQDLR